MKKTTRKANGLKKVEWHCWKQEKWPFFRRSMRFPTALAIRSSRRYLVDMAALVKAATAFNYFFFFILFKAYTEFRINRAARIDRPREQVIADHAKSPTLHQKSGESKRLFQGLPILGNKGVHIFKLWKASLQCFVVPVPPAGRLQALDDFL